MEDIEQVAVSFGNGGWVRCDAESAPGPIWVRYREAADGRLEVADVYLAFDSTPGSPSRLRRLADFLSQVEAMVADDPDAVRGRLDVPGPDLRTSAEHHSTSFSAGGREPTDDELTVLRDRRFHWVALERWSQTPALDLARPPAPRRNRTRAREDREALTARLQVALPGTKPYPIAFFEDVATAYRAAMQLGPAPVQRIADVNGVPAQTVRGWIGAARAKGVLPPARQGRAG